MDQVSHGARVRRRAVVIGAAVLAVGAIAVGVVWAASATAEQSGRTIAVDPVIDPDPLTTAPPGEDETSGRDETPTPVPVPTPEDPDDDDDHSGHGRGGDDSDDPDDHSDDPDDH